MDRATVYPGQVPLETDVLKAGQYSMVGIAKLSESVLGTGTYVSGFTLSQTGLSNLVAILGPGIIYQQANLEASAWSSMPVVTNSIEKQGILLNSVNLTFTPPGTAGQSQCFLVEVQYTDTDTGSLVLPYYNAAAPSVPFSGPGGAGTAQNTIRQGAVAYQVKAGTAATSGTQVPPTPDAGWTGIYVVTLAAGATSVNTANIAQYSGAPFIPVTLPNVPAGVQSGSWLYSAIAGAVNAYTAALTPALLAFTTGSEILVNFGTANTSTSPTLNVNGLGAKAIVKQGGGAVSVSDVTGWLSLVYDGASWRINGPVASDYAVAISNQAVAGGVQVFTATGTCTIPAGITFIKKVTVIGGGGGGGGAGSNAGAAGGSGGTTGIRTNFSLGGLTSVAITVGGGGGGGTGTPSGGSAGNPSSFGSFVTAPGGLGGGAASGGVAGATAGGAAATGAQISIVGGVGGGGYLVGSSYLGNVGGGSTLCGPSPGPAANGTGSSASGYGGGGGGAGYTGTGGAAGAAGAGGIVIVEY